MVDSLEKFQRLAVNMETKEGREFMTFKRELYQMYEVQNRTREEHNAFSLGVERKSLRNLYKANLEFVDELNRVNNLDTLVQHGKLKGSVFRAKTLSTGRIRGVMALAAAAAGYSNIATLSLLLGPNVATFGLVATTYFGLKQFQNTQSISQIDFIEEGANAGKLRVKVQTSLLQSRSLLVAP